MKTKEELNAIKAEVETLNRKLAELSEDELKQVVGGVGIEREKLLDPLGQKFWISDIDLPENWSGIGPEAYDCSGHIG